MSLSTRSEMFYQFSSESSPVVTVIYFIPFLTVSQCGYSERAREREEESCDPIKHISCLLYGHCWHCSLVSTATVSCIIISLQHGPSTGNQIRSNKFLNIESSRIPDSAISSAVQWTSVNTQRRSPTPRKKMTLWTQKNLLGAISGWRPSSWGRSSGPGTGGSRPGSSSA